MAEKRFRIRNTAGCRNVWFPAGLVVLILGGTACFILYAAHESESMRSVMRMVGISLAVILLIGWIGVQAKYQIRADGIRFTIFGIPYRTILFSDYPILLVTNAVFHIHSVSLADAMPMIDKAKTKSFGHPVCFPYFVAITRDYPLKGVRSGMSAGDLISLNGYHAKSVGLCYAGALETIRKNPAVELCVQTDVAGHYPEMFLKGNTEMDHAEQISKWIEWEIKNKNFLYDKKLEKKEYPMNAEHTHCELCWARFGNSAGDIKQGFFEQESQSWICEDCYPVFREYFRWTAS